MVDMVVHRHDLPATIANLCSLLMKQDAPLIEEPVMVDEGAVSGDEAAAETSEAETKSDVSEE